MKMEAGAKPRHLWGGDGGLWGSSAEQGCGGGRQETENVGSFKALQGPELAEGNLITAAHSGFFSPGRSLFEGVLAVTSLGHLFLGGRRWLAFTATSRAGKGARWFRAAIPLPPLPPAPARRDPCHSADAAILLLRLQPTQNAPSPREPLLHGAEHSGKGISGASPGGSATRGRAEPDPWESRPTLRASPRHRPITHAYCKPADCAGVRWPLLSPARGSLPLPVVGWIQLPVNHVRPAWFLKGRASSGPESLLGRSNLHSSWRMGTSGFLGSFDLCSVFKRFLTFDLFLGHSLRPAVPAQFCFAKGYRLWWRGTEKHPWPGSV